jgi:hypothetical protein
MADLPGKTIRDAYKAAIATVVIPNRSTSTHVVEFEPPHTAPTSLAIMDTIAHTRTIPHAAPPITATFLEESPASHSHMNTVLANTPYSSVTEIWNATALRAHRSILSPHTDIFITKSIGHFASMHALPYIAYLARQAGLTDSTTAAIPRSTATLWTPTDSSNICLPQGSSVLWGEKVFMTSPGATDSHLCPYWFLAEAHTMTQNLDLLRSQLVQTRTSVARVTTPGMFTTITFAVWAGLGHAPAPVGLSRPRRNQPPPDTVLQSCPDLRTYL